MIVIRARRQALTTGHIRPGRRSAFLPPGETVLHQGVRGWHEHALVTVLPPDQVRRRAIFPVDLHDHALAVLITHMPAPDQQLIACNRAHRHPSSAVMPRPSRRCTGWKRAKGPDKGAGSPTPSNAGRGGRVDDTPFEYRDDVGAPAIW